MDGPDAIVALRRVHAEIAAALARPSRRQDDQLTYVSRDRLQRWADDLVAVLGPPPAAAPEAP